MYISLSIHGHACGCMYALCSRHAHLCSSSRNVIVIKKSNRLICQTIQGGNIK